MTPELETALREWRDARQTFFDKSGQFISKAEYSRLANAEHALMKLARELG